MKQLNRHSKRIATDAAGYGLILLSLAVGWLPGPGGIPLLVAGLGLLSIKQLLGGTSAHPLAQSRR